MSKQQNQAQANASSYNWGTGFVLKTMSVYSLYTSRSTMKVYDEMYKLIGRHNNIIN